MMGSRPNPVMPTWRSQVQPEWTPTKPRNAPPGHCTQTGIISFFREYAVEKPLVLAVNMQTQTLPPAPLKNTDTHSEQALIREE